MKQQPTILVVEDDADDRLLLLDATTECGYSCQLVFAHDGVRAIEMLQEMKVLPDLVLLDINMPRMNGFELLAKLRQSPVWKALPVIMLSTANSSETIKKAHQMGANEYLVKPDVFDELCQLWERVWHQWIQPAKKSPSKSRLD